MRSIGVTAAFMSVRDMMHWFAGREHFLAPDKRTMRRKVSAIWKELASEGA